MHNKKDAEKTDILKLPLSSANASRPRMQIPSASHGAACMKKFCKTCHRMALAKRATRRARVGGR
jgi:cytochrome c2